MRERTDALPPSHAPERTEVRRFDRSARLLGVSAMERLSRAHVRVFGLGGVGSWAAEALARSGVGHLALVDSDRVCLTDANRQLPALEGSVGRLKAEVVAERLRLINPEAHIEAIAETYGAQTAEPLLPAQGVSYVVDAIDKVTAKLHLLARCVRLDVRVVSCMGAAGRLDPTAIRVSDLSETHTDQFAKDVRKYLRVKHGIDCARPTGIAAVWSVERCRHPIALPWDEPPMDRPQDERGLKPPGRHTSIHGTAAFVTGVFGMLAASVVVRAIAQD
jgi:tRNA A37 threonylcarbamoyladenosine dehydratase